MESFFIPVSNFTVFQPRIQTDFSSQELGQLRLFWWLIQSRIWQLSLGCLTSVRKSSYFFSVISPTDSMDLLNASLLVTWLTRVGCPLGATYIYTYIWIYICPDDTLPSFTGRWLFGTLVILHWRKGDPLQAVIGSKEEHHFVRIHNLSPS